MPIALFDASGVPLPDEPPTDDLTVALERARARGTRVIVARITDDGPRIDLAYAGPGGWQGPVRAPERPAYSVRPRRGKRRGPKPFAVRRLGV